MLAIDLLLTLNNPEELKRQIALRAALREQMVGQLYPSILQDEITKIRQCIVRLKQ